MMNSSISESFKSHPVQLNRIIPLDFKAHAIKLPDSHTWTLSTDNPPPVDPFTSESVPVIDLDDPNVESLTRHACEQWGMFQVTNHGIRIDLLIELEFQTRRLFSLPLEQKLHAVRSPEDFAGYGLPRISTFFPKLMWSEGFSIMGSQVEHASKLWPNDHTKFCGGRRKLRVERNRAEILTRAAMKQNSCKNGGWAEKSACTKNRIPCTALHCPPLCFTSRFLQTNPAHLQ